MIMHIEWQRQHRQQVMSFTAFTSWVHDISGSFGQEAQASATWIRQSRLSYLGLRGAAATLCIPAYCRRVSWGVWLGGVRRQGILIPEDKGACMMATQNGAPSSFQRRVVSSVRHARTHEYCSSLSS